MRATQSKRLLLAAAAAVVVAEQLQTTSSRLRFISNVQSSAAPSSRLRFISNVQSSAASLPGRTPRCTGRRHPSVAQRGKKA
jgi:hypothetical protein